MLVDIDAPDCSDHIWGLGFLLAVLMLLWLELGAARKATIISNKAVVCVFLQVWMFSTMIPLPSVPGGKGRRKCDEVLASARSDCDVTPSLANRGGEERGVVTPATPRLDGSKFMALMLTSSAPSFLFL
jgi:hypothetical protein